MSDEKIKECEAKIEAGEVDCQSNFMDDCCFISGTGSTIGGGAGGGWRLSHCLKR